MMLRNWIMEIEPEEAEGGSHVLRLGLKDPGTGKVTDMLLSSRSLEDFEKEVSLVKMELDRLLDEARAKFKTLGKHGTGVERVNPAEVWKKMESCASEKEMFELFNGFGEMERKEIADYIFSRVNMFKGRGPVFSAHFDAESRTLE